MRSAGLPSAAWPRTPSDLFDALHKAFDLSKVIDAFAVEVIAIDARARDFYVRYGFMPLVHDELHLYLSMRTLSKILG